MARKTRNASAPVVPAFTLDVEAAKALGVTIATIGKDANTQAGNAWATARTAYVIAQDNGAAPEWAAAFAKGIKAVKGKKAPWVRNYLSCFTRCAAQGIAITDKHTNRDVLKLLKAHKEDAADDATKVKDALKAAIGFAVSAQRHGASERDILTAIREGLREAAE